jgi:hypothetical protein
MKGFLKNFGIYFVFLVIIVAIACLFHFTFYKEKSEPNKDIQINFNEIQTEEVKDINQLANIQLIYAQREVIGFDKEKNNKYRTDFYLIDLRSEKKYKFYSTEDLTYEQAYLSGQNKILILKEFGTKENRLVDFNGKIIKDIFIPPVNFGTDFVLSKDTKKLAYFVDKSSAKETEKTEKLNFSIIIRDLATNKEIEVNNGEIKHKDFEYNSFTPIAFSSDNKLFYLLASLNGGDPGSQSGLYKIDTENKNIEEIYFSEINEVGETNIIELLALSPEFNFALINRGGIKVVDNNINYRTQIQKLDLTTQQFIDIYKDANANLAIPWNYNSISQDGEKFILTNNPNYDEGFSILNIINKQKTKITNRGDFLAWAPDSKSIIYLNYSLVPEEAININQQTDQGIELHVIDTETKNDYKIYTQKSTDEGTGLNKEGDVFYSFVGVISK